MLSNVVDDGTGVEAQIAGYTSPARRARRRCRGRRLHDRQVRRLVRRLRARLEAAPRRPRQGPGADRVDLRRLGRRAGLRADRAVRPAVPRGPAGRAADARRAHHAFSRAVDSCPMDLSRPRADGGPTRRSRRDRATSPTTRARSRRARSSSACRARRSTATTWRPTRLRRARSRSSSSARSTLPVPQLVVPSVRAAMPVAANEFFSATRRTSSRSRPSRDERQDDDGVPARIDPRRGRPPAGAADEHRAARRR